MPEIRPPLLEVRDLKKHFPITKGPFKRVIGHVRAVDRVSFELRPGQCLGLVGESGSGKTTVGRSILRALKPTAGEVLFRLDERVVDVGRASHETLKQIRRHMQMIFQDPYSSLNPRMTVFDIIGEPLLVNGLKSRRARQEQVEELLVQVGLKPQHLNRYPHAFSGGQRQRIGIARALALHPKLVVADEPVSALDVSVQAQVLNLLMDLQNEFSLTYIFIAHDLSVVSHICDQVAVMYVGQLVEVAEVGQLFEAPKHPYSEALMMAVPIPDPARCQRGVLLKGEVADPSNPPPGCRFHPRCRYVEPRCRAEEPELKRIAPGRAVRCHLAETLSLVACRL